MLRRTGTTAIALVLAGCYQQPDPPDQGGTLDTSGETSAGTDGPTTAATMTTVSTDDPETSMTTTMSTTVDPTEPTTGEPTTGEPTSSESGTTAPPACSDGTADPGELCLDGVVATVLDVGTGAFDLAIADLDGDDNLDIVSLGTGATVSVLVNDGAGGFEDPVSHTVADNPCRVFVADGDGDNDDDIVVGGEALVTLVNDGSGGFTPVTSAGEDIGFGGCGDIALLNNNGGPLDIAYTGAYSFSYAPGVNPMTGWGFAASSDLPGPGEGAWSVAVTEFGFDADSNPDVLLVNQYYTEVDIVSGNGFGSFSAAGSYTSCNGGSGTHAAVVGHIDADEHEDIVSTCRDGNFTVATGNGDGTFTTSPDFMLAGVGQPLLVDLDDDDDLDLVLPSADLMRVNVYLNDGTQLVDDPILLDVGATVAYAAVGDLNGDGALDVAAAYDNAGGHVAVFFADP